MMKISETEKSKASMAPGCDLALSGITHRYGAGFAVDGITLRVGPGQLLALLGPSGCGKTTLLRIVAGFVQQSSGSVSIDGFPIDDLPPNRREVGIVFQNYALFPHMSVAENVAYGLAARGASRALQKERAAEMLRLVQLEHLASRLPRQLSGGQQQRVALARALAIKPRILLLDEPFAALDKNLRLDMQIEVKRIQRLSGTTAILVTHDQEEALSMADQVAVLNRGKLEQLGPPSEIYDLPRSFFVNTFVGSANVLPGRIASVAGDSAAIALDDGETVQASLPGGGLPVDSRVVACIRPEHLSVTSDGNGLSGTVEIGMPLGAVMMHEIRLAQGGRLKVVEPRIAGIEPRAQGMPIRLAARPGSVFAFPAP